MVPMECRGPKRVRIFLTDIEKRAEMNPSDYLSFLDARGLSMKHETPDLSQG